MCLSTVEFTVPEDAPPTNASGVGWKVIIPFVDGFLGPFFGSKVYSFDTWVEATQTPIHNIGRYYYTAGFHIFETRQAAQFYLDSMYVRDGIVIPVEWQGLLAKGRTIVDSNDPQTLDAYLVTLVAAKIKIVADMLPS